MSAPQMDHRAGPNERELFRVLGAQVDLLESTATEWTADADTIADIAADLTRQATALREDYQSQPAGSSEGAGELAAQAYEKLSRAMLRREDEMRNVVKGLTAARDVVASSAPAKARALPPIDEVSMQAPDVANPQHRRAWEEEQRQENADLEASKNAREAAAASALRELDAEFRTAAEKMGTTVPHEGASGGPAGSGGSSALASAPPPRGTSTPAPHVIGHPDVPVDDNDGDLSGGPAVTPASPRVIGSESPAPSPGVGGTGAVGALGAAALSGAGAGGVAGSRGAAPAARSGGKVALGRGSGAAPEGGTLGRSGVVSSSQSSGTPGRGGQGGTAAGAGQTGRSSGSSRGGAAAGSRGAAGSRPASTSNGTTGRRAPLSSSATGGRRGTRDDRAQDRDGMAFDDEQAWLDDEQTGDAVLD